MNILIFVWIFWYSHFFCSPPELLTFQDIQSRSRNFEDRKEKFLPTKKHAYRIILEPLKTKDKLFTVSFFWETSVINEPSKKNVCLLASLAHIPTWIGIRMFLEEGNWIFYISPSPPEPPWGSLLRLPGPAPQLCWSSKHPNTKREVRGNVSVSEFKVSDIMIFGWGCHMHSGPMCTNEEPSLEKDNYVSS